MTCTHCWVGSIVTLLIVPFGMEAILRLSICSCSFADLRKPEFCYEGSVLNGIFPADKLLQPCSPAAEVCLKDAINWHVLVVYSVEYSTESERLTIWVESRVQAATFAAPKLVSSQRTLHHTCTCCKRVNYPAAMTDL